MGFFPFGITNLYNVKNYGATGNGITDDTAAIQTAMNAAGSSGGTVIFPSGNYLISNHLVYNTSAQTAIQLAPSLMGAPGMGGSSPDAGTDGVVQLTAAATFPVGEFMIDYIGPAPAGGAGGNTGFRVSGLVLQCGSRAAGIRSFNSEDSEWSSLVINNAAAPNPANTSGTPTGAVSFVANPSFQAWNNRAERIYVFGAAQHSYQFQEGAGSYIHAVNCTSVKAGWAGFYAVDAVTLTACVAQISGQNNPSGGYYYADFEAVGATLVGCVSSNGVAGLKGPAVNCSARAFSYNLLVGCTLTGTTVAGLPEQWASVAHIVGGANQHHTTFDGCNFVTASHTSDYVNLDSNALGSVVFSGCHFIPAGGAPSVGAYNLNGTAITTFQKCEGINPAGTQVVAVPASGTAVAAAPFDRVFYATANAAGATTIAVSGGPTVTLPLSACVPIFNPAGTTLTPTYVNAPTWVVEGF